MSSADDTGYHTALWFELVGNALNIQVKNKFRALRDSPSISIRVPADVTYKVSTLLDNVLMHAYALPF